MPKIQLSEDGTRKAFIITMIAAWLGMFLGLAGCTVDALRKPPQAVDVQKEIGDYSAASFFTRNFILLYLGGGKQNAAALSQMTVIPGQPELPPDPYTVLDVNVIKPTKTPAGKETEWTFVVGATVIPPGTGSSQRNYFHVNLLQSADGSFKAMTWPRLIDYSPPSFEMASIYTGASAVNGPLGQMLQNFLSAFYQSGNEGQLGRFVTENFTAVPVSRSPFSSVELKAIQVSSKSVDPASATPGDRINILVTAKGSSSSTTWNIFQVALAVRLSDNEQWLVDGFDDVIDFGAVANK
jgi:hypothetical protein